MKKVLIIRMSALGDVAMTIPVIYSVARRYPDTQFTILTQPFPAKFFINPPSNLNILQADIRKEYKGLRGLMKLSRRLQGLGFDAVADLHDVLRSKFLRTTLRLTGKKVKVVDKGKKEKKALIRPIYPVRKQLKDTFGRYADVFRKLGYEADLSFRSVYENDPAPEDFRSLTGDKEGAWIGIAPFARHAGKVLPADKCEDLLKQITSRPDRKVFLFGSGDTERKILEKWSVLYPNVISLAGKIGITDEIALMSHLDVMVSMDSANMHLASLAGTPVVSLWGATHPYAGFLGWNQSSLHACGVEMECRPCSIFGNKPCRRGDYACLTGLDINRITGIINNIIEQRNKK